MGQGHYGLSPALSATDRLRCLVCRMYRKTGIVSSLGGIDATFEPEALRMGGL